MILAAVSFTWIIGALGVIMTLAGVAGGAYAILRSSMAQKVAELWKEQAEALEARLSEVEEHKRRCDEDLKSVSAKVTVLEGVVTGAVAIEKLETTIMRHHRHVEHELNDIKKMIGDRRANE